MAIKSITITFFLALLFSSSQVMASTLQYELPSDQWRQISLPLKPDANNTARNLFGDDLPVAGYGIDWVLYSYDAATGVYVDPGLDGELKSGVGYWVFQKNRASAALDIPASAVSVSKLYEVPLITRETTASWNMPGYPYSSQGNINTIAIKTNSGLCSDADGCTLAEAVQENLIYHIFYSYNGLAYEQTDVSQGAQEILPWHGYWVAALPDPQGLQPRMIFHAPMRTVKAIYHSDEFVEVELHTPLSNDQDWIGVYPKGADNSWGNVIAWNWVSQEGRVSLSQILRAMPAGEYEIRLFFHNSFQDEARYPFRVVEQAASNKKLILHQKGHWLPMMADNFAARADYINTLPFSGFTMVGNTYTDRVMEPDTPLLPYSYIWNEVKGVKGLYPTKSNFLTVNMHFPGDFWDDGIWNNVVANFGTLAKVAKNLGFRGIVFDDEAYDVESHKMINYKHGNAWYDVHAYKNTDHTFVEHSAKITALFQQIMEAMVSEYPSIDVLYYHSPVEGHKKADNGINGHPVVVDVGLEREHEWTGAMFTGLKKGLSHQASLHDMGEDYKLRTQTHFDDAYAWRKHTIASDATNNAVDATQHWIVPQEERQTWAEEVNVDFMVSNEPLASDYPGFDTTNSVDIETMKTTLERALDSSDKYVIFYSASSSDNSRGLVALDWLNDPATHADNGEPYSVDPAWRVMVQNVYDSRVQP